MAEDFNLPQTRDLLHSVAKLLKTKAAFCHQNETSQDTEENAGSLQVSGETFVNKNMIIINN